MSTPKVFVDNMVVNALLESLYDVLDKDGKRSVLSFAKLENELMADKLPDGAYPHAKFLKIMESMKQLMAFSQDLLKEIGKKFAIYLNPFGTDFEQFLHVLNESFGPTEFHLQKSDADNPDLRKFEIQIKNCPFLDNDRYIEGVCQFFSGMFSEGLKKAHGGHTSVDYELSVDQGQVCDFLITWSKQQLKDEEKEI